MISYKQSRQILKKSLIKIKDEYIRSDDSLNRVSSTNIISTTNYPSANNTAFDGFAVCSKDTKDLNKNNSRKFKIVGSIIPGNKPITKKIKKFDAMEIMTGGVIAKPFDTIIPIEQIIFYPNKKKAKYIVINKKIKKNMHVRFLGSDYKKNDLVIKNLIS